MNNVANTPEPKSVNYDELEPPIWDLVISDFRKHYFGDDKTVSGIQQLMSDRNLFGIAKHGIPLKAHNGRSFINDAVQESLDLIVYLRGIIQENNKYDETIQNLYEDTMCIFIRLYLYAKNLEEHG
jgi:hypothetical protein